ncbi:uncharacterized protein LOC142331580 isoform X2 [Lycorma delicatula]
MIPKSVVWIRMNACSIFALITLPIVVFFLCVICFFEFPPILQKGSNLMSNEKPFIYRSSNKNIGQNEDTNFNSINDILLDNMDNNIKNNNKKPNITLFYKVINVLLIPLENTESSESVENTVERPPINRNNENTAHEDENSDEDDVILSMDMIALPLPKLKIDKNDIKQNNDIDEISNNNNNINYVNNNEKDEKISEVSDYVPKNNIIPGSFPREPLPENRSSEQTGPVRVDASTQTETIDQNEPVHVDDSKTENITKETENVDNTDAKERLLIDDAKRYKEETHQSSSDENHENNVIEFEDNFDLYYVNDLMDFNIPNTLICPNDGNDLYLLLVIRSYVKNFQQRKAIRETWGRLAKMEGISYLFILGIDSDNSLDNKLKHESDTYQDIVMTDLSEIEKNDAAKSIMSLKWIKLYCPNVKYVLFTNDNVFVNLPELSLFLRDENIKDNVMYGYLYEDYKPERNPTKKNYVSKKQFKKDVYPNYLADEGYIFPGKLAPVLYEKSLKTPYIKMGNILITGIVADKLNIPREDIPLFSTTFPDLPKTDKCSIFGFTMVFHPVSPGDLRFFWEELRKSGFKCGNFLINASRMIPQDKRMYANVNEKILYPILVGDEIKNDEKSLHLLSIEDGSDKNKNDKNNDVNK